jgi:hypothetical protein
MYEDLTADELLTECLKALLNYSDRPASRHKQSQEETQYHGVSPQSVYHGPSLARSVS